MNVSKTATFPTPITHPEIQGDLMKIAPALQWLDTLTKSSAVPWNDTQRLAAQEAVERARNALATLLIG